MITKNCKYINPTVFNFEGWKYLVVVNKGWKYLVVVSKLVVETHHNQMTCSCYSNRLKLPWNSNRLC